MCRSMRFWAPAFDEAKWSVRALLPVRSPLEVDWSLKRRDRLGPGYGCLLWLRHVLDAEVETRGMARAIFNWPQFVGDPLTALRRVGKQLDLAWPLWSESTLAEIDAFVSADLRYEKTSDDDLRAHPTVNDLARETYAAMMELVDEAFRLPHDPLGAPLSPERRSCRSPPRASPNCRTKDVRAHEKAVGALRRGRLGGIAAILQSISRRAINLGNA
jgi:hypothetical protein